MSFVCLSLEFVFTEGPYRVHFCQINVSNMRICEYNYIINAIFYLSFFILNYVDSFLEMTKFHTLKLEITGY